MKTPSRTNLFLLELILVILFFSLCAAICMGVFASAKRTADESRDLGSAVLLAESAAECWKAADGDLDRCAAYFGAARDGGTVVRSFDADWHELSLTASSPGAYVMTLEAEGHTARIRVTGKGGGEIYGLTARLPGGDAA